MQHIKEVLYRGLVVVFSLSLNTSIHAQPIERWQTPEYIEQSFYKIVLESEYQPSTRLNKWIKPIQYKIEDQTADTELHQQLVKQHLLHLQSITHHPIHMVDKSAEANLTIIFTTEANLIKVLSDQYPNNRRLRDEIVYKSICSANFNSNEQGQIQSATVIIPVDRARAKGKLLSCIVEELTQIMGTKNDSDTVYPSIFNDKSTNDFLTGLDYVLLKLLYDSEVLAGMTKVELMPILKRKLSNRAFSESLEKAQQAVRKNSLENLIMAP